MELLETLWYPGLPPRWQATLRNFSSDRAMPLGERDGPVFLIWFQKWSVLLPLCSFYIFIIRTFVSCIQKINYIVMLEVNDEMHFLVWYDSDAAEFLIKIYFCSHPPLYLQSVERNLCCLACAL